MNSDKIKSIDFFEDDRERESQLYLIRSQIIRKIEAAFLLFRERFGNTGTRRNLNDCLKEVWPDNDDHRIKATFFIDFEQDGEMQRLGIVFDGSSGYDSNGKIMRINIHPRQRSNFGR